jgi:hypothetical protein
MKDALPGMLRRMAFIRTNDSEQCTASIISVKRIVELGTMLAVTSNRSTLRRKTNVAPSSVIFLTLMMGTIRSSETSVPTRASQKRAFFIVNAVETSYLTHINMYTYSLCSRSSNVQSQVCGR